MGHSQKANLEVPTEMREKIQIINTFNISANMMIIKGRLMKNAQMIIH